MPDRQRRTDTGVDLDKAPPPPPSFDGPTNQMDGILGQGPAAQGMPQQQQIVQQAMQIETQILNLASNFPPSPITVQLIGGLRMLVAQGMQSMASQNQGPVPGAGMPNTPQPMQQGQQQGPQPQPAGQ